MKLEVTLKKSLIGRRPKHVKTAHALGLHNVNQVVIHEGNDAIKGMIGTISYLVSVKELD